MSEEAAKLPEMWHCFRNKLNLLGSLLMQCVNLSLLPALSCLAYSFCNSSIFLTSIAHVTCPCCRTCLFHTSMIYTYWDSISCHFIKFV